jgi:HD-like signal output (HDOD) protein/CheY-like chemotaxis protein
MNPRLHILFVDDDSNLLQALQRSLRPMRKDWDMEFADGGVSALAKLERSEFDVVVSDMKMPGINGCDLLDRVLASHPGTLRFILSGHAEQSQLMQCVGPTHQFLSKPCDTGKLTTSLQRVTSLEYLVEDPRLRHWLAHLDRLPCHPDHHRTLLQLLARPETSIDELGSLIATDPAMATLVLKLANSAFFGTASGTMDIRLATVQLGIDVLRNLGHTLHLFSPLNVALHPQLNAETCWRRSQRAARLLKEIVAQDPTPHVSPEDAYSVGLLLDVGHFAVSNAPAEISRAFNASHRHTIAARAGAYLLGVWGFSDTIVETVAFQRGSVEKTSTHPALLEAAQFVTAMLDDESTEEARARGAAHPLWLKIYRETTP